MRSKRQNDLMKLDSLLDIVTNVVGFLVIVLIAVCLNVVTFKAKPPEPEPDPHANVRSVLEEQIRELEDRLSRLLVQITKANQELGRRPGMDDSQEERIRLEALLRKLLEEEERLRREIQEAESQLEQILGKLGQPLPQPPREDLPPVSIVQVASAREAEKSPWAGKKMSPYVCKGDRLYPFDSETLVKKTVEALQRCANGDLTQMDFILSRQRKLEKVARCYAANPVEDAYFRVNVQHVTGGGRSDFRLVFELLGGFRGFTQKDLKEPNSLFRRQLQSLGRDKVWVKYLVWDDSFETFVVALEETRKVGLDVGWMPYDPEQPLDTLLVHSGSQNFVEGPMR